MYAGLGTLFTVCSAVPVAYALAKFRFRGRRTAMILVISTMMLPPQVIVIPMYLVWAQQLHLSGSLWPLIIPMAFGDAYSIFLLRQFLLTIPQEYIESAKVDGCGELRTLLKIVVPMAKPGIAAIALFQFFYCWNDYFGPQIYAAQNPAAWTLSATAWSPSRAPTASTGTSPWPRRCWSWRRSSSCSSSHRRPSSKASPSPE